MADDLAELGVKLTGDGIEETRSSMKGATGDAKNLEKAVDDLGKSNKIAERAFYDLIKAIHTETQGLNATAAASHAAQQAQTALAAAQRASAQAAAEAARQAREAAEAQRAQERAAADLEARINKLKNAIDPTRAAQAALDAEMREAAALYRMGAINSSDYAARLAQLDAQAATLRGSMNNVNAVMTAGAGSSKAMTQATLNLSRQFADIGVTAAMGMNPLMILIQQGPQIADAFAQAKTQGIGFNQVMGNLNKTFGPFMAILAPLALGITAAATALAVGTQQINKEAGDLTKGMGLTEDQLERVSNKGVTMGETLKATFQVTGERIYEAFKGPIDSTVDYFQKAYQDIVDATVRDIQKIIGLFIGAYNVVKDTWRLLPAAFGDMTASAVNIVIRAIENMINFVGDKINVVIGFANAAAEKVGLDIKLPTLKPVDIQETRNNYVGAMDAVGKAGAAAMDRGMKEGIAVTNRFLSDVSARAVALAKTRIRDEAGDGPKGRSGKSEYEKAVEDSAKFLEALEAETAAIGKNAFETKMMAVEKAAAAAPTDELRKAILAAGEAWRFAAEKNEFNNRVMTQAEKRTKQLAQDTEMLRRHMNAGKLSADEFGEAMRRAYMQGRDPKEWVTTTNEFGITTTERLEQVGPRKLPEFDKDFEKDIERLQKQFKLDQEAKEKLAKDFGNAFSEGVQAAMDGNLGGFFKSSLEKVMGGALEKLGAAIMPGGAGLGSFKMPGMSTTGSLLSTGAMVAGNAIGGRAGGALAGAGMGAQLGSMIMPGIGTAIGAGLGALAGLFGGGGSSKKKEQEEARLKKLQEEQAEALRIANEATAIRIEMLRIEGKESEATAELRRIELEATAPANRAAKEAMFALQDQMVERQKALAAATEAETINIEILRLQGKETEAMAIERKRELEATSEGNRHLVERKHQLQDELKISQAAIAAKAIQQEADGLNLEILRLSGKETEALAIERRAELEAVHESNRALVERKHALQDEAKQAQVAKDIRSLEIELMDAQGNSAGALAARRADELAALNAINPRLAELKTAIWAAQDAAAIAAQNIAKNQENIRNAQSAVTEARSRLNDAYSRERSELEATIDKFKGLAESMRAVRRGIETSETILSPEARYRALKAEFQSTAAQAAAGDPEAMERLQGLSKDYLEASRDYYASSEEYFQDFETVRNALLAGEATARAQATMAQQQLAGITQTVAQLMGLNLGVQTVNNSIIMLNAAITQLATTALTAGRGGAGGAGVVNPNRQWSNAAAGGAGNPNEAANVALALATGYAGDFGGGGFSNFIATADATAQAAAREVLRQAGQEHRINFASGAIFERPTERRIARFAESGPEAIMPVTNVGGFMGVRATTDPETRKLLAKQNALLAELLTAANSGNMQRALIHGEQVEQLKELAGAAAKQAREAKRAPVK